MPSKRVRELLSRLFSQKSIEAASPFFHWDYSGVFIGIFWGTGLAMVGTGLALDAAYARAFVLAYIFFTAAFLWSIGYWLTSDFVRKKNPDTWGRNRRRQVTSSDWRRFRLWQLGVSGAITALLMLSVLETASIETTKELSLLHGRLYPGNSAEPFISDLCALKENEFAVYMGRRMAVKASRFPLTVLKIANRPVIVIDRNNDGSMSLSLDVRSADGKIVVSLDKNGFIVNPNNYFSMERKDRSSLLVKDQQGNEVLNAHYLNWHSVTLSARLISDGHYVDLSHIPLINGCLFIEHGPEGAAAFEVPASP